MKFLAFIYNPSILNRVQIEKKHCLLYSKKQSLLSEWSLNSIFIASLRRFVGMKFKRKISMRKNVWKRRKDGTGPNVSLRLWNIWPSMMILLGVKRFKNNFHNRLLRDESKQVSLKDVIRTEIAKKFFNFWPEYYCLLFPFECWLN